MSKLYPWDYHSDLSETRLKTVACMIVDGRHTALELYDEEAGDDGWTLGCRAFQFARARILRAIDSGDYPWLTAIDRTLQLIFKVGEIPVRIYKGDAEDPTNRTLRQSFGELNQLSLLFSEDDEGRDLAYRFAIETDVDGSVLAIRFVGLRGESAILNWNVPLDDALAFTGTVGRAASESIEVPAPQVGLRTDRDGQSDSGDV